MAAQMRLESSGRHEPRAGMMSGSPFCFRALAAHAARPLMMSFLLTRSSSALGHGVAGGFVLAGPSRHQETLNEVLTPEVLGSASGSAFRDNAAPPFRDVIALAGETDCA